MDVESFTLFALDAQTKQSGDDSMDESPCIENVQVVCSPATSVQAQDAKQTEIENMTDFTDTDAMQLDHSEKGDKKVSEDSARRPIKKRFKAEQHLTEVSSKKKLRTRKPENVELATGSVSLGQGTTSTHGANKDKGTYYCKYCDTSWPYNHFRNAQQFGAHCSNCSRKRKVKDPQEMTIRERNKRKIRKTKTVTSPSSNKKEKLMTAKMSDGESDVEDGLNEDITPNIASSSGDEADNIVDEMDTSIGQRNLQSQTFNNNNSSRRLPRNGKWETRSTPRSGSSGEEEPTEPKKNHSSIVIMLPDTPIPQSEIIQDPNSIGGLLQALEEQIMREKRKNEIQVMRSRISDLRSQLLSQQEVGLKHMRLESKSLLQEFNLQFLSKIEALKTEVAAELSFRDMRRKKQLEDLRRQMVQLEQILRKAAEERAKLDENSLTANSYSSALSQLEELTGKISCDLSSKESELQQKILELQSSYSTRFDLFTQQMKKDLSLHEECLDQGFEEIKSQLQSSISVWQANNSASTPTIATGHIESFGSPSSDIFTKNAVPLRVVTPPSLGTMQPQFTGFSPSPLVESRSMPVHNLPTPLLPVESVGSD